MVQLCGERQGHAVAVSKLLQLLLGQRLDLPALEPGIGGLVVLVLLGGGLTGRAEQQGSDRWKSSHGCIARLRRARTIGGQPCLRNVQRTGLVATRACRHRGASSPPHRTSTVKPGWQWTTDSVFRVTNAVRAGRSLQPQRWPNNARVAVLLSFDADNETVYLRFGEPTVGDRKSTR